MEVKLREDFEKLKALKFFRGVIVSDSMEPLIRIGDRIVAEVRNQELERFDVIVFWYQGLLTCHYVWNVNRIVTPVLIQTKSLKYGMKDFPIAGEDILGKVISHRLTRWQKFRIILRELTSRK